MKISNGIIFIWSGTNAGIPSGWSRVTSMDDTYPKGTADATNPDTTGGATSHTHTSTAHTHTAAAHTHTITLAAGSGGGGGTSQAGATNARVGHTHSTFASGAVSSFSAQSTAVTYASMSNDPPFYSVIYITPTTFTASLPASVIGLVDAAAPGGFNVCDGTLSTPNLVGKYLRGSAAGADGGTTGGSTANSHTINHSHTTSHAHAAGTSDAPSLAGAGNAGSSAAGSHTHSVTVNAATPTLTDNFTLNPAETVEPAYTKLMAIQAAAETAIPAGIIALWKGTLSTIPGGWKLCDGTGGTVDMRGRHLKVTATVGEVGTTGGSNTHTHAAQNHTHAGVAHTHTAANATHAGARTYIGGGAADADAATIHTVSTDSISLVADTGSTSADSSSNEPSYRTVAFIKLAYRINTGGVLLNYL